MVAVYMWHCYEWGPLRAAEAAVPTKICGMLVLTNGKTDFKNQGFRNINGSLALQRVQLESPCTVLVAPQ